MFWRHLIELRVSDREWMLSPTFPEDLCRFRYTFSQGCQGILVAESSNGYPIHLMNTRSFSLKSDDETDVIQLSPSPLELPCLAFKAIQSTRQPGTKFAQVLLEVARSVPMPLVNPSVETSTEASESNINATNQSTTLLEANLARKGATIWNRGTGTLFVDFVEPASATNAAVRITSQSYYEVPKGYTGIITGIWTSPNGQAHIRELV